jgi:hypothetical protein
MKSEIAGLVAGILVAGLGFNGCQKADKTTGQNSIGSMGEATADSRADYSHEWQEFKRTSEQRIQDNENRMAAFRERSEQSGTEMKARYNTEMARLEKENLEMGDRLEAYTDDGKTRWADFKDKFDNDMDRIRKAVEHLTSDSQATYSDEWQQFKSDSESKIEKNEEGIAAFKDKMNKSGATIDARYNTEIANLEKANRGMKKKLEEYKNDGSGAWSDFKRGFNNEMDELGKALNKLTSDKD